MLTPGTNRLLITVKSTSYVPQTVHSNIKIRKTMFRFAVNQLVERDPTRRVMGASRQPRIGAT